ncbi:MAG TPA: lytic murein transglycosylase, partial [Solirubrobacterales bacterium]|nr:lytic murein transglycosylase [Solirubrobacterales bacterium]
MERTGKIRAVAAAAAATVALAVPVAVARAEAETAAAPTPETTLEAPSTATTPTTPTPAVDPEPEETPDPPAAEGGGVKQGTTLVPPPVPATKTAPPSGVTSGGVNAGNNGEPSETPAEGTDAAPEAVPVPAPLPGSLAIPSLPNSSCAISGVPPVLIPIYHEASDEYGLGAQGPAILAGINAIETAFGTNLNISSAGAMGWMQFIPSSWKAYGVDANDDGRKDPYNPVDAIFAAARYLSAAGMPADVWGAIFAYNHADWYVEEVLANAGCYADEVGGDYMTLTLAPQIQTFECSPAKDWRKQIPEQ